jgi:NADPH2:quinone reductase
MPAEVLRAGYEELAAHAADGRITVKTQRFSLDDAAQAWKAQAEGPHHKIAVAP